MQQHLMNLDQSLEEPCTATIIQTWENVSMKNELAPNVDMNTKMLHFVKMVPPVAETNACTNTQTWQQEETLIF